MHLGGTVATANLGSFERSGGQIKITGTIDNSGRTLSLNGTTGSWLMSGGTLRGGTVSNSAGAQLIFGSGTLRSEERRVGKEGGYRRTGDHAREKKRKEKKGSKE